MRIGKIQLVNFKRFDDLTIDLGSDSKKIVALVGPNGSGKSSVLGFYDHLGFERVAAMAAPNGEMGQIWRMGL